MGYSNRFVLAILVNGIPQKELANNEVYLKMGEKFSLRLRNRHSRAAMVQIYIDGENVSGDGYRIPAQDKIDIQRFAEKDASFRFVATDSAEAVEHGKNGPNHDRQKGVVEARFFLEKEKTASKPRSPYSNLVPDYRFIPYKWVDSEGKTWDTPYSYQAPVVLDPESFCPPYRGPQGSPGILCGFPPSNTISPSVRITDQDYSYIDTSTFKGIDTPDISAQATSEAIGQHTNKKRTRNGPGGACANSHVPPADLRDGVTVEGEASGQSFYAVHMDLETDYVSVKVFLKGYGDQPEYKESKTQPDSGGYCVRCATPRQDRQANYCGSCGHKHK